MVGLLHCVRGIDCQSKKTQRWPKQNSPEGGVDVETGGGGGSPAIGCSVAHV